MKLSIIPVELAAKNHYELIIIGSGFGPSFFLAEALNKIRGNILILEWGGHYPWDWQIERGMNSKISLKNTAPQEILWVEIQRIGIKRDSFTGI